jgi:hypothetical protein
LKVKDCLRKIAKPLQSLLKAAKKSISTTWVGRATTNSKYKRKKEWKERNEITDRTGTIVRPRTINGLDNFLQSQEPCHDEVFQPSWKGTREGEVDPMHLPHH